MNKNKLKNVAKATGVLVKESCKLVAVTGQAVASALGAVIVVDTAFAGLQEAANVRGKSACGVKPKYETEGHLWNKHQVGVVETPFQSFKHELPKAQKGGRK